MIDKDKCSILNFRVHCDYNALHSTKSIMKPVLNIFQYNNALKLCEFVLFVININR